MKRLVVLALFLTGAVGVSVPRAQMRVVPVAEQQGHTALGLVLRHLNNTGIFMMATAHPDDENNALLVMLNRGQGYRTALATATRGNGGQNEIGPEIFEALGVLRTQELEALHRFDGAEQYFTRAVDFGFSFSVDETFEKWGREEILGDYVRLIRTIRPDVIAGLTPTGTGGGQHHQASAILAREAFLAAGDATKFPEQIAAGLRPWQPKKFYFSTQFGGPRDPNATAVKELIVNLAGYDRLLGKTFAEIGTEARSMHKCQGMAQLLSLPGPATSSYTLAETTVAGQKARDETGLFDGVDSSIAGLAQFAGARPPRELREGLEALAEQIQLAQKRFDEVGDAATLAPLSAGLKAVRALRATLRGMSVSDSARYEIDFRLRQKEREFQQAIVLAAGLRIDALADDGVVIPGQPLRLSVFVANRGAADVAVRQVKFEGFDGQADCALTAAAPAGRGGRGGAALATPPLPSVGAGQVGQCTAMLRVPSTLAPSEPYWHRDGDAGRYTFDRDAPFGLPYRPTPFYVQMTIAVAGGEEVFHALPVEYRYEGDIFSGEKRMELLVVPPLSVRMTPDIAIVPNTPVPAAAQAAAPPASTSQRGRGARPTTAPAPSSQLASRELRVTVVNDTKGAAEGAVRLSAPSGWSVTPAEQTVSFSREDEAQTVRFQVRPATATAVGSYPIKATATLAGATFDRGYQVIEYPHIRRQHIYNAAAAMLKIVDIKTAPNLTVGYVMGVGDAVPPAIEQLGAKVELIGPEELAWGNLSRFSTIVTGVRAYERRGDLRAQNSRLLDYVREGGTLIVQYNKMEFNEAQYGPWPAKVSSNRVTDEFAPVRILAPVDPIFNAPNKVTDATWKNWVQERGLYFLGEHDSRYRELLAIDEPFPYNRGEKQGALVAAQYGRGRWVYVGLGLWRELPAGVDGAYQLLANLISLGH
jgi:LmbE family N-acetylglucosaminyl deacetylase